MKKVVLLILSIFMISACSPANQQDAANKRNVDGNQIAYGLLGPGPINYGVIRDDRDEYAYDGYINTSPSFRTLDRHRHDLGDDQDKIRTILLEEGVDPGVIYMIGKDIYVHVNLDSQDQNVRNQRQNELENILTRAMRRYDIHVRVNQ